MDPVVLANLLDDRIWALNADVDSHYAKIRSGGGSSESDAENARYLTKNVFPALVPALHELLALVVQNAEVEEARKKKLDDKLYVPTTSSVGGSAAAKYGPTAHTHPVDWIAQHLFRHNQRHTKALEKHPYCVILNRLEEKSEAAQK